jgi:hypothetical protein
MSGALFVLLGLGLGFLIHFLLSRPAPRPAPSPDAGGRPKPTVARTARRCPLCGSPLGKTEGVTVEPGADGSMILLGCPRCLSPSERN